MKKCDFSWGGVISCKKPSITTPVNPQPEVPEIPVEPAKIPINISTNIQTKATDSRFETGDKVGIYVVNYSGETAGELSESGNHVDNMGFTYNNSWKPETPIYWKDDKTKADFYCYYPYAGSISDVSAHSFAVKEDQSTETNYKASDFLWGKTSGVAPTPDPIDIWVKHSFSNILVYLEAGNGYNEEDLSTAEVLICNIKPQANINLKTGEASATGNPVTIKPKKESGYYRALVVPQSIDNQVLVKVIIDNREYALTQTIDFTANKQHKCTITVNKVNEGINIGIGGWETDDMDYGGTVE